MIMSRMTILLSILLPIAALAYMTAPHDDGLVKLEDDPFIYVLGIAQDAGYPQAACRRGCCVAARRHDTLRRHVVCIAIVDPKTHQRWIIDATPDFREQLHMLDDVAPPEQSNIAQAGLDGILLTHAHMGHYTGLMQLGREVMGSKNTPVYVMPRMRGFLESNGPWDQLVELQNIELRDLQAGEPTKLNQCITITPLLVPHRDEYSETVGYRIEGPNRSILYIPDIDKWDRWDRRIEDEIAKVDIAYLDGTFFRNGEIAGRDMSQIPHPFIEESMRRFESLSEDERAKIRFIHLNHTNPALQAGSDAQAEIERAGFGVAAETQREPI